MDFRNLVDFNDISGADWRELYITARDIIDFPDKYADACRGKIMATLFYEPSTRTQFSFQSAMMRMGGSVIGFSDANDSSVAKGETLRDTIKIMSNYADVIVMRTPFEGSACAAALYSRCPVVNAGDGGHMHPTQTMTDLLTIAQLKGGFDNMSIGLCGDLLNGRTIHSFMRAMARYRGNTFYLVSTPQLSLPAYVKDYFDGTDNKLIELNTLDECIPELDILYMTRIQRERFSSVEAYEKQRGVFVLDKAKMDRAKHDLSVLHPLPKLDEIAPDIDDDPRANYFLQAQYGIYIRMALILKLSKLQKTAFSPVSANTSKHCVNPRCITNVERVVPSMEKHTPNGDVCAYCDREMHS